MRKLIGPLLGALCVIGAIGCGGNNIFEGDEPTVRFVNALRTQTSIQGFVDTRAVGGPVARDNVSPAGQFDNGNHEIVIKNATTGDQLAHSDSTLFERNTNYMVVAFNADDSAEVRQRIARTNEDTTPGQAEVTFFRATNDFGNLDLYLVKQGEALTADRKVTLTTTGEASSVLTVPPGEYRIRAFAPGDTTTELFARTVTLVGTRNDMLILTTTALDDLPQFIQVVERQG